MRVLAIDVGGTHVKFAVSDRDEVRRIVSGPYMTAERMVQAVLEHTRDWDFDAVAIGCPAPVANNRIVKEPVNLGPGWTQFDFAAHFGKPIKIVNDAAMQAIGSYDGGCMLFLGLGTGLGSSLVRDGTLVPLELGHLPYRKGRTFEDYVGLAGLKRLKKKKWRKAVNDVVERLRLAMNADHVVLGGGNAKKLKTLPPRTRVGDNRNAIIGGFRLWQGTPSSHDGAAGTASS
jgi:polyphosphate glucokinase